MADDRTQAGKHRQQDRATGRTLRILLATMIAMIASAPLGGANGQQITVADPPRVSFEKVFLAAFSHVVTPHGVSQPLAATMVIHNIDPEIEITLSNADYFDENGKLVKSFLKDSIRLAPLSSHAFIVTVKEQPAGFAARFLVEWSADKPAFSPILEGVMIGGAGTQGISFTTAGKVVERRP